MAIHKSLNRHDNIAKLAYAQHPLSVKMRTAHCIFWMCAIRPIHLNVPVRYGSSAQFRCAVGSANNAASGQRGASIQSIVHNHIAVCSLERPLASRLASPLEESEAIPCQFAKFMK